MALIEDLENLEMTRLEALLKECLLQRPDMTASIPDTQRKRLRSLDDQNIWGEVCRCDPLDAPILYARKHHDPAGGAAGGKSREPEKAMVS